VRNPTPASTQRAEPAPPYVREGASFVPCAVADRVRLLDRDGVIAGDAPERRSFWIFTGLVTEGDKPPNACVVVSQWQLATAVDEVFTAGGTRLRGAYPPGGDSVTVGDVAAGAGRGVAGVSS
jgi:hypothetical protein